MNQKVPMMVRPNRDQSLFKLVAIITMMIDHAGVIFFPSIMWLRVIGRIAFPLFCWGIVIGVERTRDWKMYLLRLAISAIVSQPFYMLALSHSWIELNVLVTLLLGMISIQSIKAKWYYSHIWGPFICLMISAAFRMDYGWRGVLLIILLYLSRNSRGGLASMMISFCLFWGTGGSVLPRALTAYLTQTSCEPINHAFLELTGIFKIQTMAILALPLMLISTRSKLKLNKWVSYLAYPGHLAIYWIIKLIISKVSL